MKAFHNDPALKKRLIDTIRSHRAAETLVQGTYWDNGKGCAVGCLLEDPNGGHEAYESQFGIPEELAYLEDGIFEELETDLALAWPERFLSAIPVGADLSMVGLHLKLFILETQLHYNREAFPRVVRAVELVITLLRLEIAGETVSGESWSAAWAAARSAGYAGYAAARSAESAGYAAARSAESAGYAAARSAAAWSAIADELIRLLEAAPVEEPTATESQL